MTDRNNAWLGKALGVQAGVTGLVLGAISVSAYGWDGFAHSEWFRAFWVMEAGFLGGILAVWRVADQPAQAQAFEAQGRRKDLEASKEMVVQQLTQLELEKHKLTAEDYRKEREELLAVGSSALRQLDPAAVAATSGEEPATPVLKSDPPVDDPVALAAWLKEHEQVDDTIIQAALQAAKAGSTKGSAPGAEWRGALYTVAIVGLIALLYYMAGEGSQSRAPGAPMTGGDSVDGGMTAQAPAADPQMQAILAQIEAEPGNVALMNDGTQLALARQDMQTAMTLNQQALTISPEDPTARTYKAVMLAFIGRRDQALASLGEITTDHPDLDAAWIYTGLLQMDANPAAAVEALEKAAAINPDPQILAALNEAKRRKEMGPSDGLTAPPAAAPAAPTASGKVLASGTLNLAEGANPTGANVFVSVGMPGGGPPLAAVNLPAGPFPMDFTITEANLIPMAKGRPMPEQVVIKARLDADGSASTRPPTDPSAEVVVSVGSEALQLNLAPKGE